MSVWLCTPSARSAEEANHVLTLWRQQGYKIALWRDPGMDTPICDFLIVDKYPGHAAATNALIHAVLGQDAGCDWVVNAGDDTEPDLSHTAEEIARELSSYFGELHRQCPHGEPWSTLGVCQPTGDRFCEGSIDRIAGSPFIGREFAERAYSGKGPLFGEYYHMWDDSELQEVAIKLGCFVQRRDLIHLHHWWGRDHDGLDSSTRVGAVAPEFLNRANSIENWNAMKAIFDSRKAAGFPGHELV